MRDTVSHGIGSIFSVLPDVRSDDASREVLDRYLARDATPSAIVKWAEFDRDGGFLRGGGTDLADLSTRVVSDPDDDADIAALARAAAGPVQFGRIAARPDGARCHWYVPFVPTGSIRPAEGRFKGLSIGEALLGELVEVFNGTAGVTAAEKRVLFQLLRGATPREAADEDAVSFETKRAQIKGVCAKLGCRGQSDLIRVVMGLLPHLVAIADTARLDDGAIERFTRDYLAPDVRLVLHRLANGRLFRTFECGPGDGTPLLIAHGMLYPLLLLNCRAACERLGIRVVLPVRSGYLDNQPATALYAHHDSDDDFDDLALFISDQPNGTVTFAGHSLGAGWALAFAARHPDLIDHLLLLSPHFPQGTPTGSRFFAPFLGGLKSLAGRPGLYRYVAWQFRRYFIETTTVRRVLRRLYEASADDIRVLEGEAGSGPVYDWFASAYRSSIVGIAADMSRGMCDDETKFPTMQVTVIRGRDDPLVEPTEPNELAVLSGSVRTVLLPNGGHLIAASHPDELWGAVARYLKE